MTSMAPSTTTTDAAATAPTFTPAPAPQSAAEALALLRAQGLSAEAALELLFDVAKAMDGMGVSETEFADAPGVSMFEAAGRLYANLGLSDEPYDASRRAEAREAIASTVAWGEEPEGNSEEVDSDFRETYVACCYGEAGDEPGDCWVQVNRRADGAYVLTEGDEAVQNGADGVFLTLAAARAAARALAEELDEGDGLVAEGVVQTRCDAARDRASDTGEWAFGFVTPEGEVRVEQRFEDREDVELLVDEWFDKTKAANPGTNILWHLMTTAAVLQLVDGEWGAVSDDE